MNNSTRFFLINLLGCLAFLSIPVFSSPDFDQGWNLIYISPFQKSFVRFFILLGFFYAFYYFFIPKFYFGNKKILFGFALLSSYGMLIGVTEAVFGDTMKMPSPSRNFGPPPNNHPIFFDSQILIPFLLVIALAFLIKINARLTEIHDEKLSAEVSYLKAQINPHFLFNTLNSLYALTLQKSNEAPNAVLKLSSIMRYVVTESSQDFVALDKEINYIKDYIELQKLRLDSSVSLSFEVHGTTTGKAIAPLILIPFIENAFKYGINPDADSYIKIAISVENQLLQMNVKNAIAATEIDEEFKTEEGLKNTQKRLDLIYSGKYDLEVTEDGKEYDVNLKIELV
ncbi:MAG TPA: sensor histidine kinase [Flavobacterium sp.]|uniref:sensor histidine kinase n=1 Tax=Flavobacterium sp. TaxID=239 RepID=UPI002CE59BF1|nr:sensor histidine kinase [Flavobacterium sp.]HNP33088.1 sensor histidine kinase [Flavobacterium sp.]